MNKLVVLGAGESGVGTAVLAQQQGYEVFVSDRGVIADRYKKVLVQHQLPYEEGLHSIPKISKADLVVKSPGIPDEVPVVQYLLSRQIPVVSEIEFAAGFSSAVMVGITGSNGKTTTTALLYHLLKRGGICAGMGGNIGDSFAGQVASSHFDVHVLELSSFQLDGIDKFAPHIAIITNITPDHLDRYDYDFDKYTEAKFRITKNQTESDFLIYDHDDPVIRKWLSDHKVRATLLPFSTEEALETGAFLQDEKIVINHHQKQISMDIKTQVLTGKHNQKNALAASMAAALLHVRKSAIKESLENFEGVEHRMEKVKLVNKVQYINDSKATNVNAAYYALETLRTPIVWIVGGVDKGNDYMELMSLVREKVKAIVCLGIDNQKILQTFSGLVDLVVETAGAEEAVKVAASVAEKGDTVLLSPACASFDLFENYEDRGHKFKQAVSAL
ncbi:MAG: UDP-N-acetylmuramoyl-L-alanine--D-glutamate ligase [Lutibacter sp.]|nr:UDP-N-acetylmuramoyl-L-alanine--D-glutamate ligase [Lutibacter sp.]